VLGSAERCECGAAGCGCSDGGCWEHGGAAHASAATCAGSRQLRRRRAEPWPCSTSTAGTSTRAFASLCGPPAPSAMSRRSRSGDDELLLPRRKKRAAQEAAAAGPSSGHAAPAAAGGASASSFLALKADLAAQRSGSAGASSLSQVCSTLLSQRSMWLTLAHSRASEPCRTTCAPHAVPRRAASATATTACTQAPRRPGPARRRRPSTPHARPWSARRASMRRCGRARRLASTRRRGRRCTAVSTGSARPARRAAATRATAATVMRRRPSAPTTTRWWSTRTSLGAHACCRAATCRASGCGARSRRLRPSSSRRRTIGAC
jgi:hypothetical protein